MNLFADYFYKPIFNLLVFLTQLSGMELAIAIVLLTIIVKTVLLYPSVKATISQKKLQNIQPHVQKLQEIHKDDKQKIAQETMKLWKEHNVNPSSGCLPLLLQLPFLIALYQVVYSSIPQQKDILYPFLQHIDLSKIDYIFLGIDITKHDTVFFPVILGLLTYFQIQMSMVKNANMKKEQQSMQNIMSFAMPLMIAFMSMQFSIALSVYWFVSTLYTIVQTYFVNMYTKQHFPDLHNMAHASVHNNKHSISTVNVKKIVENKSSSKKITKIKI